MHILDICSNALHYFFREIMVIVRNCIQYFFIWRRTNRLRLPGVMCA